MVIYSFTSGTVQPKGSYEGLQLFQPLSPRGFKQADEMVGKLELVKWDLLVTSPATRAIQTCQITSGCADPVIVPSLWRGHHPVMNDLQKEFQDRGSLDSFLNHARGNEVHKAGQEMAGEINQLDNARMGLVVVIFSHPIIAQLTALKLAEMVDGGRANKALEACRSSTVLTGQGFMINTYNDTYSHWRSDVKIDA